MKNKQYRSNRQLSLINRQSKNGFTLIELVITVAILAVLALATVPLVQNAVRRQKEQLLRDRLREIRLAIDEFHRDVNGPCTTPQMQQGLGGGSADPRQRVSISDCKVFEVDNLDRFPPSLDILVEGIEVTPRNQASGQLIGGRPFDPNGATGNRPDGATGSNATEPKKKVYLRDLPVDPITGESDWKLRSPYQEKDAQEWDNISVFDVRSAAEGETLDGIKYGDL